jgi:FkbM family methyltransferase
MFDINQFRRLKQKLRLLGIKQTFVFYLTKLLQIDTISVKVPGIIKSLLLRPSDSDIDVLTQVFEELNCDVDLKYQPRLIIDGGAYVGYTTIFFANKYPNAKIIAIEPDKENFNMLCYNCLNYQNIVPIRGALWNKQTYLTIYNPKNLSWSIRVSETPYPTDETVKSFTIPELINQFDITEIDLLKLDIEGSEETLFSSGYSEWIYKVRSMIIEVHGEICENAVIRSMRGCNFTVYNQGEKIILLNNYSLNAVNLIKQD